MLVWLVALALFSRGPKRPRDANGRPYLPDTKLIFYENFSDPNVMKRWHVTRHFRYPGKWAIEQTFPLQTRQGEKAIVTKGKEQAHAISHKFRHPIEMPKDLPLVIQYEVRSQFLFTCTGAYMRLYTDPNFDQLDLNNDTFHIFEFGPERCWGFNQSRFNFFTNESGKVVEHKLKHTHWIPIDEISHLYTLILYPNNSFETLIDNKSIRNGTLIEDMNPPVVEPEYIDDPNDKKPSDWDDRVLIPDPTATKPKDWEDDAPTMIPDPKRLNPPKGWLVDEPKTIPDVHSRKPREWNEELMGPWKPQQIPNPKCQGKKGCGEYKPPMIRNPKARGRWRPPIVHNPKYKGEWKARKIKNPNYHNQQQIYQIPPLTAIGFDIWTGQREFAFTNILIGTNVSEIKKWNAEDFLPRQKRQVRAMKINYDWIDMDEPDDKPGPGVTGYVAFEFRELGRWWAKLKNKPAIIAISSSVVMITIPLIILCCELCREDPTFKTHYD